MIRGRRSGPAIVAVLACAAALACERPEDPAPGDAAAAPSPRAGVGTEFVGAAKCSGCHPAEADAWRGSHHDLAMQEPREDTVLGDFDDARFVREGNETRFFRRGERYVVATRGRDGRPTEAEVAYVFGVDPLQQLLVTGERGRLQAFGIAWDARPAGAGGQRWIHLFPDAAPGDPDHWTGIDQTWNHMCAECHSTALEKRYDLAADRYATHFEETDVSCEACHGPGSAHVAWAESKGAKGRAAFPASFEGRGDWRLTPGERIAHLASPRIASAEVDACGRCHARRATLVAEYAHGRPLLDTHRPSRLDEGLYFPDGQIRDEVYVWGSFVQSRMYAAGVACSDCHDPHALAIEDPDVACRRCHEPAAFAVPAHHHHEPGSEASRCVTCHMPERVYMEVDGRRDHSFPVPRPDLGARLGTPDACTACHADRDAAWADAALRGWFPNGRSGTPHFALAIAAGRRGAPEAHAALRGVTRDAAQPAIVRATALRLLASLAGPAAQDALRAAAQDASSLVRLAAAESSIHLPPPTALAITAPLLRDATLAVRIEAASALANVPTEHWAPGDRSAHVEALAEYRAAQAANADRPEAHANLGGLHARFGEVEAARREFEIALRLDPDFVPAAANLADLHRATGDEAAAERVLQDALARNPEASTLHHSLGLTRIRQGRHAEALPSLALAAALAPDSARFAFVHGLALYDSGERERGLAVLEDAHARHPGDAQILSALAGIHRDAGHREEARKHARALLALDPTRRDVQALVAELEAEPASR